MNDINVHFSVLDGIKRYLRKIYIFKPTSYLVTIAGYPWKGTGAILMYHRVLPDEFLKEDLDIGMAVSLSNFEEQIKILKSKYKIVSIDEFNENLKRKKKQFMVTITFDDGYKDNFTQALPILEKYNVPATIYITTRFLNESVWMWWYELKNEVQNKTQLNFQFENTQFNFELKNQNNKNLAFENLRKLFLNLKIEKQIKLLEIITGNKERKNYSMACLTRDEIKILDKHPLITIGSHSHNHLNLSILEKKDLFYEISKSTEILKNLLNHEIKHFSYPYGQSNQVSKREFNAIRDLNFDTAVTTQVSPIINSSPFLLPRMYVGRNTCAKTLINHLSGFYNLLNKIF